MKKEETKQKCENCKQFISKYGCACGKQIEEPKLIFCGEADKFYRCVNCDTPCGSEGHFIEEPKQETLKEPFKHKCKVLSKEYIMENRSNAYEFIDFEKQENDIEEYFLDKIKEVLQFGNDAQAIRFMEKYYQAKKRQDENNK